MNEKEIEEIFIEISKSFPKNTNRIIAKYTFQTLDESWNQRSCELNLTQDKYFAVNKALKELGVK